MESRSTKLAATAYGRGFAHVLLPFLFLGTPLLFTVHRLSSNTSLVSADGDSQHDFMANLSLKQERFKWRCCANISVSQKQKVQTAKNYDCVGNPSNFSYFVQGDSPAPGSITERSELVTLNETKWLNKSIAFVGDSTTRQMYEQLMWELPRLKTLYIDSAYLFSWNQTNGLCCTHDGSHSLDLRELHPGVALACAQYDFVLVNVATWWTSNSIGKVIDIGGNQIDVVTSAEHWRGNSSLQSLEFASLMERALHMMLANKKTLGKLIWRSESHSGCRGYSEKKKITPVLKRLGIHVLNISAVTCDYVEAFPDQTLGPHLCFPSVALRYWLKSFEDKFLG